MEYKFGDTLPLSDEQNEILAPIVRRFVAMSNVLDIVDLELRMAHGEIWAIIRETFPDEYKKYDMGFSMQDETAILRITRIKSDE